MDDLGVKGTRRARVRARGEFRKRETDQVGRNDLQGGRRRKEGSSPKVEGETWIRGPEGVDLSLAKGPFENDERKERRGWEKEDGPKGVGSHSEAISGHVTRINLATRIFFWPYVRIRLPIKHQTTARISAWCSVALFKFGGWAWSPSSKRQGRILLINLDKNLNDQLEL